MNTDKLFGSLFPLESPSRTKAVTALIGGLAVGAAVAFLFATDTGKAVRLKICDAFNDLCEKKQEGEHPQQKLPPNHQPPVKRPKSDIKTLAHHTITEASHTEQGIG